MISLSPLGDSAYLARFARDEFAASWAEAVRSRGEPWIVDVVAAYSSVAVFVDPDVAEFARIESELRSVESNLSEARVGVIHEIPVVYDGVDLHDVAARLSLNVSEVIEAHCSRNYRVSAIGFLPGFPYAGELPEVLRGLPRRASPRPRVAAGSVAIVGKQTAVYPGESPGGWHLIGRTPLSIVDVEEGRFPISVGDFLAFFPSEPKAFDSLRKLLT